MTEAEWLACRDPAKMLAHLGAKISNRKLRLFSCACCRRVWQYVRDERLQTALDTVEQYTDKLADDKKRLAARQGLAAFRKQHYDEHREEEIGIQVELWNASTKSMRSVIDKCGVGAAAAFAWAAVGDFDNRQRAERTAQTALVRDIFGNPFRKVKCKKAWLTSDVVALARGIYDERAFDRMPILADALQDAGCDSEDMLSHCRMPSDHVRGCWVVDLVLGKS
jgi:hypothetical protein